MSEKTKKLILQYVITTLISASMVVLNLSLRDFNMVVDYQTRVRYLADAFTIPGVVIVMVGALVWISTTGGFDMLTYALGRFARALIPFNKTTDETFYDYKTRKDETRLSGYSFLFVVGALFLAVGIVFTVLYY